MNDSMSVALSLEDVTRSFKNGAESLHVLQGVNLSISRGEAVALIGPSGSGKSTLLQIAGLLEQPTTGTVKIAGQDVSRAGDRKRTQVRRKDVGFIYQFHHLLPEFNALENVFMPLLINGISKSQAKEEAQSLLKDVGLEGRADHRPAELSGGEQQRVAIARALAANPALLLADEPTGNLDPKISGDIFEMMLSLVKERNMALLMVTHNHDLTEAMDHVYQLTDGSVISV